MQTSDRMITWRHSRNHNNNSNIEYENNNFWTALVSNLLSAISTLSHFGFVYFIICKKKLLSICAYIAWRLYFWGLRHSGNFFDSFKNGLAAVFLTWDFEMGSILDNVMQFWTIFDPPHTHRYALNVSLTNLYSKSKQKIDFGWKNIL